MSEFTIYPAIDLRGRGVVRLKEGDPTRQTAYSNNPAETARRWLSVDAKWLHVINLDGAFDENDTANQGALRAILSVANEFGAQVQFERLGYFCVDPDTTPERPVFNEIVPLKDTWKKIKGR